ncbi:MAG: hypothetical protein ACOC91_03745 [bacterium]
MLENNADLRRPSLRRVEKCGRLAMTAGEVCLNEGKSVPDSFPDAIWGGTITSGAANEAQDRQAGPVGAVGGSVMEFI